MHVLVTGGSGFIGQHLVSLLAARGETVRVLDIRSPSELVRDVDYVMGSVLDQTAVDKAMAGIEQVYHLAGLPGMWMPDKQDFYRVNCLGTEAVLAAARKRRVRRFLHCSTESILFRSAPGGNAGEDDLDLQPANAMPGAYTRSKALAEHRAAQAAAEGFPVVIGTPTMPIGPHDQGLTPPAQMLRLFLNARVQFYLDFVVNLVDVRDVALGLILAMERGRVGHRYVLGGESIRLKNILRLVAEISGRRHLPVPVPGPFAEMIARMLDIVSDHITHRAPNGTAEGVRIARRSTDLSIAKARSELGYAPRPVEPTLRETLNDLRAAESSETGFDVQQRPLGTAH